MNAELLMETAMARAGIADRELASRATEATLEVLAECLPAGDAADLAQALPARLAAAVRRARRHGVVTLAELFEHISGVENVRYGLAVEHGEAVCEALAEHLDPEMRARLQRHLPAEWAALFEPRGFAPVDPEARERVGDLGGTLPGHGHTLATGRPGSRHPISEAAPLTGQSDSVVATSNPHGDSKLSSAHEPGVSDTLASGRPGSEEPLADAHDERRDR